MQGLTFSAPRPLFGAQRQLNQPGSINESQFTNERVVLPGQQNLIRALLEKLDEAMTVGGELYSGNEAFTSLIDIDVQADKTARQQPQLEATVDTKVEQTLNVGKLQNVGIMVLRSDAKDYYTGTPIATGRATFNAIDPASVQGGGALKTVPVQLLSQDDAKAADWNKNLSGFYRALAKRLGASDPAATFEDLTKAPASKTRLVNSNIYVTTDMLNKKQTGHGGITAAMAVNDMAALVRKLKNGLKDVQVHRVTANYLAPYRVSDALQTETTLDYVDNQGNIYLSSRIYKLDTKKRLAEGPVILVNAKLRTQVGGLLKDVLKAEPATPESTQRATDAQAWKAAIEASV